MSQREVKQRVYRACVTGSMDGIAPLREQYSLVDGWVRSFKAIAPDCPSPRLQSPRRLNHFCIGSDPEFSLVTDNHRVEAYPSGIMVGTAVGADQNERLVELRPWPSTSIVEHLAGILSELRWLYRINAMASVCQWRAGAFYANDGIGGHVHFGRKSSLREDEIAGLNALTVCLAQAGMFPLTEWARRVQGDERGQIYGKLGDTRIQKHGFEYRTLPSWLNTVEQAFAVLTLSKLVLLDPSLVIPWAGSVNEAREHFTLLAKYYKGRDDDALILYKLLQERWPKVCSPVMRDFKVSWGIPAARNFEVEDKILPTSIKPLPEEVTEMHAYLTEGTPLQFRRVAQTFRGTIPNGYEWLPRLIPPQRQAGVGDFIHDLVVSTATRTMLWFGSIADFFEASPEWADYWSGAEQEAFRAAGGVHSANLRAGTIGIPKPSRQVPNISAAKRLLLSGLFPVWSVETVQEDSFQKWKEAHPKRKKEKVVDRKVRLL